MIGRILAVSLIGLALVGPRIALAQSNTDTTTYGDTLRKKTKTHMDADRVKQTSHAAKAGGHAKKGSAKKRSRAA
jgi:hypothetical protein